LARRATSTAPRAFQNSDTIFNAPTVYQGALALGDNSYQSNYTSFTSGWGRIKSKLYLATGNHDYSYLSSYDTAIAGAAGARATASTTTASTLAIGTSSPSTRAQTCRPLARR